MTSNEKQAYYAEMAQMYLTNLGSVAPYMVTYVEDPNQGLTVCMPHMRSHPDGSVCLFDDCYNLTSASTKLTPESSFQYEGSDPPYSVSLKSTQQTVAGGSVFENLNCMSIFKPK